MALAPADFYAYSRATGVPVPEDPEERAEMAPEVLAFRRNQLKAPESQGPDPLSIGIGLGLAAAGLGGAAFGLNRLFRGAGKGQTTTPAGANLVDLTQVAEARIPKAAKQTTPPQSKPYTFVSDEYEEVPFPDVNRTSRVQPPTDEIEVPPADERAQSFVQAAVDDLVSSHQQEIPIIAENTLDSLESGSDQLDTKLESVVQRDIDSVRYSKPIVAVEKYTDVVNKLTSSQKRLMTEFGQYGVPKTDLDDPATSLKRAGYQFEMNDWSDGPPESVLDDLGNFLRQEEMRNQRMQPDAFNLSGARGDLPGVSEMSLKERKRYGKQIGLDLRPSKDQDPTEFFGDVDTSDFEGPVQGPSIGEYKTPVKTAEPVISKIEIADRISAAANYADGSLERSLLLNPLVPTERVRGLLGSALRVEQGRVGRNLTHEITPGARASMTEVPGWKDEQAARRAQMTEEVIYDEYAGDTPQVETMSWEDYESSTDLGEGEGPGGLTLSRTFDERTGKSRTDLPGQYHLAYGGPQSPRAIRPLAGANQELYARQERIDRVMPTRSTEEGDTSRGFRVDPQTGRLVFEGSSERDPMGRLRPTDPTMMVEGDYEDRLVTKLTGGFQAATGEPSPMVSTQPATAYYDKSLKGKADPRVVRGSDGKLYVKSAQTQVTGEEPLVAFVGKRTTNPDGSQGAYVFLEKQGTKNISLPLNMLTEIVQDAKDTYLNNPSAKKEFLARRYPEQLEQGMAEGKLLSEMGDAISYNDFIIESLDKGLQSRGYKLPVLQPSDKGYYPKAAHEFISNVGQVTKESPVFGYPALIGPKGGVVYQNTKYGKVPAVDKTRDARPIPGLLDIRGTGGVDAMSIAEDYEGGVAFHAPRIETAPQVVRQRSTGNVLTATQAAQSPGGLLSTGEAVPRLTPNPRPQFTVYPNVALRTIKTPDFSYVATEFLPPVQLEVTVDPETGRRYQTSNVLSQEKTVYRPYKAPSQSTASSLGMTGQQLANLRLQMETKPTGYTAPYLSNFGGGFIANTKTPFSSNAFYASGPVGGPLPQGGYVQLSEPTLTRFGYLSRNERGVGASRNLNLGMGAQPTVERPVSGFESPRTEEVSTYNIGQAMKQLMAQAGRRRGSRKS